jgi:hypothetical protein
VASLGRKGWQNDSDFGDLGELGFEPGKKLGSPVELGVVGKAAMPGDEGAGW